MIKILASCDYDKHSLWGKQASTYLEYLRFEMLGSVPLLTFSSHFLAWIAGRLQILFCGRRLLHLLHAAMWRMELCLFISNKTCILRFSHYKSWWYVGSKHTLGCRFSWSRSLKVLPSSPWNPKNVHSSKHVLCTTCTFSLLFLALLVSCNCTSALSAAQHSFISTGMPNGLYYTVRESN